MPTTLPVAGYYRVSQARDDMHAPELYETEIRRYCEYKQLTIGKIYSDIDHSAFRGAKPRPSLQDLVEHRAEYAAVVIPKLSRFGRSMKELIKLFDVFDSDDIPLVFLDMDLDTSTSQGRLLRHILAAFAEYESDVKADYTRATHRRIRAEGRPWGVAPMGYKRGPEPATWVIDEAEAAVVAGIFEDYGAGSSANAIAHALNRAGIATPRGRQWKGQGIGKMLDNPAYAALSILDDDLVPAQWEAIIDRATWDKVRRRRANDPRRRGNLGRPRPRMPYLLSGLMWCGLCGRKMTHTTDARHTDGVYHCGGQVWSEWSGCLNMRLYGPLAEDFVSEAFLERCAFTILEGTATRAGAPRKLWAEASLTERKRLLGLVIDRIVVTPTDISMDRTKYRTRLRHDLAIQWKSELAESEEIVVLADEPVVREAHKISHARFQMLRATEYRAMTSQDELPDSTGKTWAQWQRELRESRRRSVGVGQGVVNVPARGVDAS